MMSCFIALSSTLRGLFALKYYFEVFALMVLVETSNIIFLNNIKFPPEVKKH